MSSLLKEQCFEIILCEDPSRISVWSKAELHGDPHTLHQWGLAETKLLGLWTVQDQSTDEGIIIHLNYRFQDLHK